MTRFVIALIVLTAVAGCGADGEPVKPKVSGETGVGYSSSSGAFTETTIGLCFGNSC